MKMLLGFVAFIQQTWATAGIAFKRLLTQRFLSIAAIAGLMIASGFILSIPLYADATYFRLFREELFAGHVAELANHPVDYAPMAFTFATDVAGQKSPQWQDVVSVDHYLSGEAQQEIKFPIQQLVRFFRTDGYFVFPPLDSAIPGTQYYLTSAYLATMAPMESTIQLVHGNYPQPFTSLLDLDSVQAMASESLSEEFGIQIGDVYYLRQNNLELPVTIVGIWRPVDLNAPYWDNTTPNWFVVNEESYKGAISDAVPDELRKSMWYIVADGSSLHASDVAGLDERIKAIQKHARALLPEAKLTASPLEALSRYQKNAPFLTYLLYAFSVPILGLILAFIGLVTGLFVGQQRGEMAILRSRGASSTQVVGISMLQGILLGIVALAGGVLVGYWIAHAIGRARSFLDFTANGGLRVSLTVSVLTYGIIGIGVILLVQVLIPTLGGAGNTIVTYKQERARSLRPPWWQRLWFDVILLIPAGYGLWQLQNESRLALSGKATVPSPLQNPLLLIAPAIGIFAVALFTLRLIPRLMSLISWSLRRTKSVGVVMAARYLARTPAFYSAPLVLLLLTLGLSAFTASLAKTLDAQLEKQTYYRVGSDLNIHELGTTVNSDSQNTVYVGPASQPGSAVSGGTQNPVYTFGPVEEHLGLKGVLAATRVGRYKATVLTPTSTVEGTFLGIDRISFPTAAYWQSSFALQPLAVLMNTLGADPEGVLVPNSLIKKQNLKIGDKLTFGVQTGVPGESVPMVLTVVGSFDLFPTWYPNSGPIFVGNLDEMYLQAGTEYPHDVWLRTSRNADAEGIIYAIRGFSITLDTTADQNRLVENGLNTLVQRWSSTGLDILAEQSRPERQGLFGLLSVGFIASALLTVLGFMLYALFSFRRRFIEMGMLRAIGLSIKQMTAFLAAELASLILVGIVAGTVVGVYASKLFVPFLQIGSTAQAQYPPFQIQIAWLSIFQIYGLFIVLFIAALSVLSAILVRMKIFQAIKTRRDKLMTPQSFIECENLVKIYKMGLEGGQSDASLEVQALQGLDITIAEGEMIGIVGASGSGKSTLLNILGGLDRPTGGRAVVNGKDLGRLSQHNLDQYRRQTVGFVWQYGARNLIPYLTALENIQLPMTLSGRVGKKPRQLAKELLNLVGLSDRMEHRLEELSGGEQQRVAVAISLANQPQLLLADEPTGELDTATAKTIYDLFRDLNHKLGLTIVIVSHDPGIAKHVDRVVAVRDGKLASETLRVESLSEGDTHHGEKLHTFEELVILDSAGRLQLPRDYLEHFHIKRRVRLEIGEEGILIRPPKPEQIDSGRAGASPEEVDDPEKILKEHAGPVWLSGMEKMLRSIRTKLHFLVSPRAEMPEENHNKGEQ